MMIAAKNGRKSKDVVCALKLILQVHVAYKLFRIKSISNQKAL
jgi:hypothetical protein